MTSSDSHVPILHVLVYNVHTCQVNVRTSELIAMIDDLHVRQGAAMPVLTMTLSPSFPVNADSETRHLAEIPENAFSFAYVPGP